MIDPGWVAAGLVVGGNVAGWVLNHNHSEKEEARREGKVTAELKNLGDRVDRLERRIDELITGGGR